MNNYTPSDGFQKLYNIVKQLRSPGGCPWDAKQSPDSLKESLIEETYECVDAIIQNDIPHVCEELGDVFLLATFISIIYEEKSSFTTNDVFDGICEKLIRRHPHVFGDAVAENPEQVIHQWEEIKDKVEGRNQNPSIMDSVPKHYPPLLKASKIQKKASKTGFDWDEIEDVFKKLDEETNEFKQAVTNKNQTNIEEEIGDLLFTIVNISRFLDIDPSTALTKTNNKFIKRFKYIEKILSEENIDFSETGLDKLEKLWQEAKK